MAAGSIVVDLLMRTGSFETDTKRAEATAKKRADAIGKAFEDMGQKIGIAAGAAATALTAMVVSTANTAKEITNLAQLSGAGTQEFQRFAAAAKSVGVEQDQLGDIFKDFREKIGEFVSTGGGEMKDFFEQIAPKIGITADAFRNLSGPQALQLYFDSLQKAGLSTEQISFYLESAANDATKLIPLLRDSGLATTELGDAAERTGRVMNDDAIRAATEFSKNLGELMDIMTGLKNKIAAEMLPTLNYFSGRFLEIAKDVGVAKAAVITFGEATAWALGVDELSKLSKEAKQASDNVTELGGKLERAASLAKLRLGDETTVTQLRKELESEMRRAAQLNEQIKSLIGTGKPANLPPLPPAAGGSPWRTPPKTGGKPAAPKAGKAAAEPAAPFVGPLPDESVIKRYLELEREALSLKESLMTADEKRAAQLATWQEMMDHGLLTQEQFNQLAKEPVEQGYWEQWLESAELAMQNFDELANNVIKNFTNGFGNAFEQMIFDSKDLGDAMRDFAEGMLRSFVNAVGQMIAQWLAFKAIQSATGGGLGGIVGSFFGGGFAQGGPVLNDRAYLVGERGPEIFVPNTAGSIIPNNQTGAGGNVTVNLIEDRSRAGKTESRMNNGAQELDVFVADIMGDGPRSKAIRQAFGLQRRGY